MKRLFSGPKSPDLPSPSRFFKRNSVSSDSSSSIMKRSWSASNLRKFTNDSLPETDLELPQVSSELSPELIPIVTLLSAQAHRRYHEGVFLILHDLKSDGSQADRVWRNVYGVLIGTQLALWDAAELSGDSFELKNIAAKPTYINFTDAVLKTLSSVDKIVTESRQNMDNTLVVSTTLKNRFFIQFSNEQSFNMWHAAIRLSLFECTSLQEAYTGAFLSSRGSKLGDIKVVLADTKFNYEDWVSVRFGAGMPWKRCYAVISQPGSKKNPKGKIFFYENDKKVKKSNAMATLVDATAIYAVYPSSNKLIDTSTIIKVEGKIIFNKEPEQEVDIFIMPEKHQAVPGYDTIIRFLIPSMNTFKLYGRPKRLIANKDDQQSLLFGLPTLPHIYYLKLEELLPLVNSASSLEWSSHEWSVNIKELLQRKLTNGYTGCGSSSSLPTSVASPRIGSKELFGSASPLPTSDVFLPINTTPRSLSANKATFDDKSSLNSNPNSRMNKYAEFSSPKKQLNSSEDKRSVSANANIYSNKNSNYLQSSVTGGSSLSNLQYSDKGSALHQDAQSSEYSSSGTKLLYDTGDLNIKKTRSPMNLKIENSNTAGFNKDSNNISDTGLGLHPKPKVLSTASDLAGIYDKYSASPFGQSDQVSGNIKPQSLEVGRDINGNGAYDQYIGSSDSKTFEISHIADSSSSIHSVEKNNPLEKAPYPTGNQNVIEEFDELSKRISQIGMNSVYSGSAMGSRENLQDGFFTAKEPVGEDNIFDPDYVEQNNIYASQSNTESRSSFNYGIKDSNSSNHSVERLEAEELRKQNSNRSADSFNQQKFHDARNFSDPNIGQQPSYNSPNTSRGNFNQMPGDSPSPIAGNNANFAGHQNTNMPHSQAQYNLNIVSNGAQQQVQPPHGQQFRQGNPPQNRSQPPPMQNMRMGPPPPQGQPGQFKNMQGYAPYGQPHQPPYNKYGNSPTTSPYGQRFPQQGGPTPPAGYNRPHPNQIPMNAASPTSGQMPYNNKNMRPNFNQPPVNHVNNGKVRPKPSGGFSQFMPSSATNNPYSR
ncbi:hypothetical protein Kpol_2000p80 [Vanderwaltozyma polyspora DSM 70294]|uniref:PH domain-containing protein n=1 Tax=Vanderwaltozyma polyspora (strain ATCC 22028 / DSM 70294 / BCRC 21397 / CBS 2163 / NBRC 10782 / NRRL Y-8283 / UCD 57-17) TaxID=436907 RepID=A7TF87_VANPO|nr:uncharacterized protein Kpol_2000p80 [Vanderwaltozyma polyspora DSM 70294]EDO19112.1 hypothetical protein Kpol_2000p80 [Vanderwaltozyma polyspora DSM 70294]